MKLAASDRKGLRGRRGGGALEAGRSIAEWTARGRRSIVNEQAARYKHLGDVVVMEAIPKSPSGKILRRELRDR